jgi:hypothetical protein
LKTLILDIETTPNLAYVWALWDQNVGLNQIVDVGQVICFAAKWLGEKKVEFRSDYHDGHDEMIRRAYELIDEADAIVHFNGKAFDIKWLNTEFLLAGFTPPAPHKDIDLLTVCRSRFKFPSNKLQYVAQALGLGGKEDTGGFELWINCMKNDPTAWRQMKKYNMGDVELTERLYNKIRGWVKNHPSVLLYNGNNDYLDRPMCPDCESTHVQKRGTYNTKVSAFQQYQCQNIPECGSWFRETLRMDHVKFTSVN